MLNRPWWVRVTWRCCATGLLAAGAIGVLGYSGAVTLPAVPTLPWWALLLLSYLLFHLGVFRLRNRPT